MLRKVFYVAQAGGMARKVVSHAGAEPTALLAAVDKDIGRLPRVSGSNVRQVTPDFHPYTCYSVNLVLHKLPVC